MVTDQTLKCEQNRQRNSPHSHGPDTPGTFPADLSMAGAWACTMWVRSPELKMGF